MKTLVLTRGLVAQVDDADFDWLNQWKWCAIESKPGKFYAVRRNKLAEGGDGRHIYLHKFLMPGISQVDHKDGNKLNCQRGNLRSATDSQNCANSPKRIREVATSRFKGVQWRADAQLWRARIREDGKEQSLGYFQYEEDAARAYDVAARRIFGEFARLNFP